MAKTKQIVDAEHIAKIVDTKIAEAKSKRIPFLHPKSIGLWLSIAGAFFVAWNGYTVFRHDRRMSKNEELIQSNNIALIPTLIHWDSLLFFYRFKDSIAETQRIDDLYDSLYDHRLDLETLYNRRERIIFRGN